MTTQRFCNATRSFPAGQTLRGRPTAEEMAVLRSLRIPSATPLFYYRILQNLRDPLNFK